MKLIDIDMISRGPYTLPRTDLSESFIAKTRLSGITDAVIVKTISENKYEIIGDPKSWYLAQEIQIDQVPAIIADHLNVSELEQLSQPSGSAKGPVELANEIAGLIPAYKSLAALGRAKGMSRATICNLVRIDRLPVSIKAKIEAHPDLIKMGHAKVISGLGRANQIVLVDRILKDSLSVHKTEEVARELRQVGAGDDDTIKPVEVIRIENELSELIGCATVIDLEKGNLIIDYQKNNEILQGVLDKVGYTAY